ncbi:MAG: DNA-directed RNA polymerase subunit omega [Pseudoclavibacter sp.]
MTEKNPGIIDPPIDELLTRVDNKYQLVIFASRRARQINDYYADLHEGALYQNVGPLVESNIDDKALSISLREINEQKLVMAPAPVPLPLAEEIVEADDDGELTFDDDAAPAAE